MVGYEMRFKSFFAALIFVCMAIFSTSDAYAANYSNYMGKLYSGYGMIGYSVANINIVGFNDTQGFAKILPADVTINGPSGNYYQCYLNYTLPDDGSYWRVQGSLVLQVTGSGGPEGGTTFTYYLYKIDTANSTPGSFSGYSPKTATVTAGTAATIATSAMNAANSAKASADTAVTYTWDSTTSKSAATLAREARENAGTAYNEAHTANVKLDNIQNSITNIQNNMNSGDITPPTLKIRTVSGAVATSGNYIQAVLDVSDNASTTFTYSLDGITYQAVPANKLINLSVNHSGSNVILVWVKDQAGNVGTTSITIRKF